MEFKRKKEIKFNNKIISNISSDVDLDENVVKLLFMRGFDTEDKIKKFLNPDEDSFHDPYDLLNMYELIDKIKGHIDKKSKIVILGDYDTDGISASAIMYKTLLELGVKADVFLPNRIADGYGLSVETIDKIKKLHNPDFIITVDCGISSKVEVEYCKKIGIEIAITDHHDIPDEIPDCIVVNPKLKDQKYPFRDLCGAGVAFKVAEAMLGFDKAKRYLTIASLATVADIVPLTDENRAIVYFGLKNQKRDLPLGLRKLLERLKFTQKITSGDISYKLAPKINASGRMGDAIISFYLYIEEDLQKINQYIDMLLEMNEKRLTETNNITNEAIEQLKNVNISKLSAIVVYNEKWESGVLGIISSKLVEIYNRPACVLTKVDNVYKGSVRSIPAVNVFEVLNNIKSTLVQFGGHNQAAGVTVSPENLEKFKKSFNDYIFANYPSSDFVFSKNYDMDLSKVKITEKFVSDINKLEPFGLVNEKPLFKISFNGVNVARMTNYFNHIKLHVNNIELLGFNMGDYVYNLNSNCNKNAIIELNLETYYKKTKIKGIIRNITFSQLNTGVKSDIINASYLLQMQYLDTPSNKGYKVLEPNAMIKMINKETALNSFGTLVIANTIESYNEFINENKNITNFDLYKINNTFGENCILFAPINLNNFKNYSKIFLLDPPVHQGYVNKLSALDAEVYIPNKHIDLSLFKKVRADRDTFAKYHNAIKFGQIKNIIGGDFFDYFEKLKALNPQFSLNITQMVFVVMVLNELGIIEIKQYQLVLTNVRSELKNSKIYNFIKALC